MPCSSPSASGTRSIPAKSPILRRAMQGPAISGNSVTIGVDCDLANVGNVAGAARLAEALSPELNVRLAETPVAEPERKAG
jgi:hypothetical protein